MRFSDGFADVGQKTINVGSKDYPLSAGEWAVFNVTFEGDILGLRD
jgi:hypothetical protein